MEVAAPPVATGGKAGMVIAENTSSLDISETQFAVDGEAPTGSEPAAQQAQATNPTAAVHPAALATTRTSAGQGGTSRPPGRPPSTKLCQYCGVSLMDLQAGYFKRYRICPEHRDAESVVLDGKRQRFCQQCGCFHTLDKFNGAFRSCRDRLKRHAVRRRKGGKGNPRAWDSEDEASFSDADPGGAALPPPSKRSRAKLALQQAAQAEVDAQHQAGAQGARPHKQPQWQPSRQQSPFQDQQLQVGLDGGGSLPVLGTAASPMAAAAHGLKRSGSDPYPHSATLRRPVAKRAGPDSMAGLGALLAAVQGQGQGQAPPDQRQQQHQPLHSPLPQEGAPAPHATSADALITALSAASSSSGASSLSALLGAALAAAGGQMPALQPVPGGVGVSAAIPQQHAAGLPAGAVQPPGLAPALLPGTAALTAILSMLAPGQPPQQLGAAAAAAAGGGGSAGLSALLGAAAHAQQQQQQQLQMPQLPGLLPPLTAAFQQQQLMQALLGQHLAGAGSLPPVFPAPLLRPTAARPQQPEVQADPTGLLHMRQLGS